jgi:hypothetical protein
MKNHTCSNLIVFNFLLFLLFFVALEAKATKRHCLAIGAIFKNERPYLKEWIEFHRLVGVEHFYLYNNLSTDHPEEVLNPYIKMGIVELIDWPYAYADDHSKWIKIQQGAYSDILKRAKRSKWIAFIDTDEFLFPVKENNLQDVLEDFTPYGAVSVNWQCYGTSHVAKIPSNKLLIEMLTLKASTDDPYNYYVKSIVQPQHVQSITVHYPNCKPGFLQVNTNKEAFKGNYAPYVLIDKLRINHYWTRDEHYFNKFKLPSRKNRQWKIKEDQLRAYSFNHEKDKSILRFVPQLRKRCQVKETLAQTIHHVLGLKNLQDLKKK